MELLISRLMLSLFLSSSWHLLEISPSLYIKYSILWYAISFLPVGTGCPGYVPFQLLVHFFTCRACNIEKFFTQGKHHLASTKTSVDYQHQSQLNSKYSTILARRKIGSIQAETRTELYPKKSFKQSVCKCWSSRDKISVFQVFANNLLVLFLYNMFLTSYNFCTACCKNEICEKGKKNNNKVMELHSSITLKKSKTRDYLNMRPEVWGFFSFFQADVTIHNIVTLNNPFVTSTACCFAEQSKLSQPFFKAELLQPSDPL